MKLGILNQRADLSRHLLLSACTTERRGPFRSSRKIPEGASLLSLTLSARRPLQVPQLSCGPSAQRKGPRASLRPREPAAFYTCMSAKRGLLDVRIAGATVCTVDTGAANPVVRLSHKNYAGCWRDNLGDATAVCWEDSRGRSGRPRPLRSSFLNRACCPRRKIASRAHHQLAPSSSTGQ
jgi:hypothetical protein